MTAAVTGHQGVTLCDVSCGAVIREQLVKHLVLQQRIPRARQCIPPRIRATHDTRRTRSTTRGRQVASVRRRMAARGANLSDGLLTGPNAGPYTT